MGGNKYYSNYPKELRSLLMKMEDPNLMGAQALNEEDLCTLSPEERKKIVLEKEGYLHIYRGYVRALERLLENNPQWGEIYKIKLYRSYGGGSSAGGKYYSTVSPGSLPTDKYGIGTGLPEANTQQKLKEEEYTLNDALDFFKRTFRPARAILTENKDEVKALGTVLPEVQAPTTYYVCTGAILRCSQGTSPGRLTATSKRVSLCEKDQANITDHVSLKNISSFGLCRSLTYPPTASATSANFGTLTPMPCIPGTCMNWSAIDANSILAGSPALLNRAKLSCMYNGTISIVNAGQSLEKTGADTIDIDTQTIPVERYFWADSQGNEYDMETLDGNDYYALCLKTSLTEGEQLEVNIGNACYHAVVGNEGIAKIENVEVAEIDWNLPITATGKAAPIPTASMSEPPFSSLASCKEKETKPEVKQESVAKLPTPTSGSIPYNPYQINEKVRKAQSYLNEYNGNKMLTCDGRLGKNTRSVLLAFQKKAGLNTTGELDAATLTRLETEHKKLQDKQKNDNRNAHPKGTPHNTSKTNVASVPQKQTSSWGDPVANPRIRRNQASNLYGPVRRYANGKPKNHQGFDYYAPVGTNIRSVADGLIYRIEYKHSDYGNNVTIKHPRGKSYVYSFYAHLSKIASSMKAGKVVKKGDIIGYSGTTGNAQGMHGPDEHMHFEARTSPVHQLGLGGKENPNHIVATKFYSANPASKNQTAVTVIKK